MDVCKEVVRTDKLGLVYLAWCHLLWLRQDREQPESFLVVTFGPWPRAKDHTNYPTETKR